MNPTATPASTDRQELDLSPIDRFVEEMGRESEAVVPILQEIQRHYRYLPEEALRRVCEITEITPAQIAGVSTFYTQFRHQPVGEHMISVCHGTACHVQGAQQITDAFRRHLDIPEHEDTDAGRLFTVQKVNCLGCCSLAPVLQIDGVTYGHLTPDIVPRVIRDFLEAERNGLFKPGRERLETDRDGLAEIRIGMASCGVAGGSVPVKAALEEAVEELAAPAVVKPVGCVGLCHQTPIIEVVIPGEAPVLYARVKPQDAEAIVRRHFKPRGVARKIRTVVSTALDHLLTDESWEPVSRYALDVREGPVHDLQGRQKRIATEHSGSLDPFDLDDYLAHEGFEALRTCLAERSSQEVIEAVKQSRLRGRGGAGFPTGVKWELVHQAGADPKYVLCNGDEGDPGAFMDRMILESFPFRVLEGMAIAAYAVGAHEGLLYIRSEYPLAVQRIWHAIQACEERGLLGDDILGSGFSLKVGIREGAGAFVCGEETALLASIEGGRGTPRLRPPYPAEAGLWGQPTLINNVETFAVVPWIIRHGPEAFAALGTESSKGTKVFALAGKVKRGGLIEVPMGITIREIVEDIGGGVPEGRQLKAVQIGGPSGGCIPADLADTRIDFDALGESGAIMGSGGLVVLDDSDCMVDMARYFLEFTQHESCGKCTACRIGTRRMLDILDRLTTGEGKEGDLEDLEELARMVKDTSICGLGQTAPNPVLTTLRYFRDEYEAHLEGHCPAGKCVALITYSINDNCIGCTRCAQRCPAEAIAMKPYEKHEIDPEKCIRCDTCRRVCPADAIDIK